MNILIVHNRYQFRGGEDECVDAEVELLKKNGHNIQLIEYNNTIFQNSTLATNLKILNNSSWNLEVANEILVRAKKFSADIVHIQNFWPLISPAIHFLLNTNGFPTIQHLHNYRLLCLNPYLLRNGKLCEKCLGKSPFWGVIYGCYRNSNIQSFFLAKMIVENRIRKTWEKYTTSFITLSDHSRQLFSRSNIDTSKFYTKPNFVEDPLLLNDKIEYNGSALYVGRLSKEKGINTLLTAWKEVERKLLIIGDGPLRSELTNKQTNMEVLGWFNRDELFEKLRQISYLILPSECYETFGRVVIEAYACGKPVIASRLGALAEIVKDGVTGLLFEPGNPEDLKEKINLLNSNRDLVEKMGMNAREEYLKKYSPEKNYECLIDIYQKTIERYHLVSQR